MSIKNRLVPSTLLFLSLCSIGNGGGRPYKKFGEPIDRGELWDLRLAEVLPQDAVEYVKARSNCVHWGGEEAYDAERGKQIAEGSKRDCAQSDKLQKIIEKKYPAGSPVSDQLKAPLADAENFTDNFVWNDPEKKSAALNDYYESKAQSLIEAVDRLTKGKDPENRKYLKYQQEDIGPVLEHIDRLHPITQKQILQTDAKLKDALR